jgi:putative aldouronate transport system permease protein
LQYGALISLPSVLLLLIFRRWITSEVLLSQIRRL